MAFGMVGPIITEPQDHLGLTEAPNYNAPFEVYAPAVWEQAQEVLSWEALSDYAHLGRVRGSESENIFGQAWDGAYGNDTMVPESRVMDPEEATKEYGFDLEGNKILNFKDPISVDEAKLKRHEKIQENNRLLVISRIEGFWPTVAEFSLDIATGFVDPLALASVFFPYIKGTRTFGKGFLEASLGTGVVIAPGVAKEMEFQKEWGVAETLFTMGLGGVIGGTISKGLGIYAARKMEGVEKDIQEFVDIIKQETPPLEGHTLERFQFHLGEVLETGKMNSFDAIDNITTLQQSVKKQQELDAEVKELVHQRQQLEKYEDSPEKIEILRQVDEAIKENRIKADRVKKTRPVQEDKPAPTPKPEEEYGSDVKFTKIEDSIPKESKKGLTREENRERVGRRNNELQRQLDTIAMRSIGALDDQGSQIIVRNALRKLLSEFSSPEVAYWIKNAPYEDIDKIINKVREKNKFDSFDDSNLTKEGWEVKEPKFEKSLEREEGGEWQTIHHESRYQNWQAKALRDLFKHEITNRRFTIGQEAYKKNLSDFKSTVSRAVSDDLEATTIVDKPDIPNKYTTAEDASAVADAETLNIVHDMTSGQATTNDDLSSLIAQAQQQLKKTTDKTAASETRQYIAKLKKMEIAIKRTQEELKGDKKVEDSIESAGNCIDDDVPY